MGRSIIKDLTAAEYERMTELAAMICESTAYTTYTYQGKNKSPLSEHDLFLKMLRGWELGLEPFASLDTLYNEHGRITMQVGAMIALVRASGHMDYYKEERSKDKCEITVHRKGDISEPVTYTYTYQDAKAMGLTKSANYQNQPDVMLFNRCASKAMRSMFNDIVQGIYVESELTDGGRNEEPLEVETEYEEPVEEVEVEEPEIEESEEIEEEPEKLEPEDEYEEGELIEDDEEELEGDEEEFDPVLDMIEQLNLQITPEQYVDGMTNFSKWCVENIPEEQYEDYNIEDWIFDVLGSTYPIYTFIDWDEESEEEFEARLLPWGPDLEKNYKGAIKTHIDLNKIGFDEEEAGDGTDYVEGEDLSEDDEPEEIVDEENDDEEEEWGSWDEDEWEDED
jgi:hypothetical protein